MGGFVLDVSVGEKYGEIQVVTHDNVQWHANSGFILLAVVEHQVFLPVPEPPSHVYPRPPPEPPRLVTSCLFVMGRARDVADLHARLDSRETKINQLEEDVRKLTHERDAVKKELEQERRDLAQRLADAGSGKA